MISAELPDGYRPCVGIALFNRAGQVFIGHRKGFDLDVGWQMPQGGIDEGEMPADAARRELAEETGVGVASCTLLGEIGGWLSYDLPAEPQKASWKGRWRGQAQRWFAFRLDGPDSLVEIHAPPGGHRPEFDDWRWETLSRCADLIVPFKRPVYLEVIERFAGFANST